LENQNPLRLQNEALKKGRGHDKEVAVIPTSFVNNK
jgi:hypothetical protein